MKAQALLKDLAKQGKSANVAIYRRHGVQGPCYGVSHADLGKLTKQLGADHQLSLELWETGIHDARMLATKLAEPERLTAGELERWLAEVDNYVLDDAVSSLAGRSKVALTVARKWVKSRNEWRCAAGWNVVAMLAVDGRLPTSLGETLIERIRARIGSAPNRAKYSMNNALIAIGGSNSELRELALEVAKDLGSVEVDHGQTGCKTPDAAQYIARMTSRKQTPRQGKDQVGLKGSEQSRAKAKTKSR